MNDNLPFVLAMPADNYACGRYRVRDPFAALQSSGLVDGVVFPYFLDNSVLRDLNPDIIVVQRILEREQLSALARYSDASGASLVMDIDDLVTCIPSDNKFSKLFHDDTAARLSSALSFVDRLVCSTLFLSEQLDHSNKVVCSNSLPDFWSSLSLTRGASLKPRVGWAGSAGHLGDLKLLYKVVPALAHAVDWVFFGHIPNVLARYAKEVHPHVPIDDYPQKLASLGLDLAVAPLQVHPYNDAKSCLRVLELGSCGFPVICSDVRAFDVPLPVRRCSSHPDDWIASISDAIEDRAALAVWGDRLRSDILAGWLLSGRVSDWSSAWGVSALAGAASLRPVL